MGCGKNVALSDYFHFTGGGVEHEVYLDLPANYDRNKPYRLVFGFHDINDSAKGVSQRLNYYGLRLKDSVNTIFVAPHGYTDEDGRQNPWRCKDSLDHLFFAELLTYLNENLCVDTSRVFAVGFSFGAMMANSLAQDFQDRLRGVAVFATMDQVIYLPKNKGLPIAWMGTVGMGDDLCPRPDPEEQRVAGRKRELHRRQGRIGRGMDRWEPRLLRLRVGRRAFPREVVHLRRRTHLDPARRRRAVAPGNRLGIHRAVLGNVQERVFSSGPRKPRRGRRTLWAMAQRRRPSVTANVRAILGSSGQENSQSAHQRRPPRMAAEA